MTELRKHLEQLGVPGRSESKRVLAAPKARAAPGPRPPAGCVRPRDWRAGPRGRGGRIPAFTIFPPPALFLAATVPVDLAGVRPGPCAVQSAGGALLVARPHEKER